MPVLTEHHVFLFLIEFAILLGLSKVVGAWLARFRIPELTAEILVGVLAGPTLLGRLAPALQSLLFPNDALQRGMLETMSWVGIMLLLLATGLEVNFGAVWKNRRPALRLTVADVLLPLAISAAVIFLLPEHYFWADKVRGPLDPGQRLLSTVFLAAIMAISALPVAIRAMHELNLLKTDMGLVAVTALSIHDIVGWVVFTVVLGIFSQGRADPLFIAQVGLSTILFAAAALTVGRWGMDRLFRRLHRDHGESSALSLAVVVLAGLLLGAATLAIGVHCLLGFFLAGVMCGSSRKLSEKSRSSITQFVTGVFVPLFFVGIGLRIDIVASFDPFLVAFITLLGTFARFAAAYLGAWWGGFPRRERVPLGVLNMPGGAMHVVIANIALGAGLISQELFVAIVFAAVLSSMALGPLLVLTLPKMGYRQKCDYLVRALPDAVEAPNRHQALTKLCLEASRLLGLRLRDVLDPVYQREEVMTTAWEKGVAVPHARIDSLREPVVLFGRSQRGIEWDTPDGLPVKLVFLVLTPPGMDGTHLEILRGLALALRDDERRRQLLESAGAKEMEALLGACLDRD